MNVCHKSTKRESDGMSVTFINGMRAPELPFLINRGVMELRFYVNAVARELTISLPIDVRLCMGIFLVRKCAWKSLSEKRLCPQRPPSP